MCCPPEKAREVFAQYLAEKNLTTPQLVAEFIFDHFDLAPKGTLQPLKDAIAALARGDSYKG